METYTQLKMEGVQDHKHCFVTWTKPKPEEDIKLGGCTIVRECREKPGDLISERYTPSPARETVVMGKVGG